MRDSAGDEIYRTWLKAMTVTESLSMTVVIPSRVPAACPTPAPLFTLHIWNHKSEPVELYQNETPVGTVKAKGEATFGPFPGDWRGLPGLVVRDASGKERPADAFGPSADYDLGQVPEIRIAVN